VLSATIDFIAMLCIAGGIGVLVPLTMPDAGMSAILYAALLAYSTLEIWTGATPGKMLLRLRISDQDCAPAMFWPRVLRWSTKWMGFILTLLFVLSDFALLYWLAGLMNLIIFIGCLHAANDDRLAWHDQWAHTAVCYRPRSYRSFDAIVPPPPLPPPSTPPPDP
jgi:uncharacterized RDD family membrane protein YckC